MGRIRLKTEIMVVSKKKTKKMYSQLMNDWLYILFMLIQYVLSFVLIAVPFAQKTGQHHSYQLDRDGLWRCRPPV